MQIHISSRDSSLQMILKRGVASASALLNGAEPTRASFKAGAESEREREKGRASNRARWVGVSMTSPSSSPQRAQLWFLRSGA